MYLLDLLGNGIFNVDGQAWQESRALLRPLFAKTRISQLETFERHTEQLISLIGGQGQAIDISDLFYNNGDQGPQGQAIDLLTAPARKLNEIPVIRDQLINIILAGRDTTAGTLSFLFRELSANPDI
ncbi:MAG: hypothetical protein Q9208_006467 [Pyrenodesmia sp. 3 TL-2023]